MTITVEEKAEDPNKAPVANDDSATTAYETAVVVDVLANDSDADGDALSIKSMTNPAHGTVSKENGELKYTPKSGFSGTDTFNYTVTDGEDDATAKVTIHVDSKKDDDDNKSDDTWFKFPDFGSLPFLNGLIGNDVDARTTEGSENETFLGQFTKNGVITKIKSSIEKTRAMLFGENKFAIVDLHGGNMQIKVDEDARVMPRMPKIDDAVLPQEPLPLGTEVDISKDDAVKFTVTMTKNIQF